MRFQAERHNRDDYEDHGYAADELVHTKQRRISCLAFS